MKDLGLLITHRIGFERNGRLHGRERNKLEKMVWNHIAQSAGGFIVAAALFYPHGFRGCDPHVINKTPVPDGLKAAVSDAKNHEDLYSHFYEIWINADNI